MSNNPLVSVVIPLYNKSKYIKSAIESVINQTYKNIELFIVDDNSSDNSLEIANSFSVSDKRIKIISHSINRGVAASRNDGILASKGEYIALLDADDIWKPNKLERQVEFISKNSADIVYCSYGYIDDGGNTIDKSFIVPKNTNFNDMLVKSVFSCSTIMYKREIAANNLFNTNVFHEDFLLWCDLLKKGYIPCGDQEILAYYRLIQESKSADKLLSAKERWGIYRNNLNLSFVKSIKCFMLYALNGIRKYY